MPLHCLGLPNYGLWVPPDANSLWHGLWAQAKSASCCECPMGILAVTARGRGEVRRNRVRLPRPHSVPVSCSIPGSRWLMPARWSPTVAQSPRPPVEHPPRGQRDREESGEFNLPQPAFWGRLTCWAINQQSHSSHKINFLPNIYKTFSRRIMGRFDQSV